MEVRAVRIVFLNLLFLIYLFVLGQQPGEKYSSALLVTMCLALFAIDVFRRVAAAGKHRRDRA
jgi:hypothetical protein